jgi:hypothetical protein
MKISELNTNTFLNGSGSPENSYLLINYAATQGAAATTQKTSLETVAKAVAAKLNLPIAVVDNQNNITGFQRVRATGNQYQTENLNAQLGGGGASTVGFGPIEVVHGSFQSENVYAYPLYYIPLNTSDDPVAITDEDYNGGRLAILDHDETNDIDYVLAWDVSEMANAFSFPSMGGGDDTGGGNGSNSGC